MAPATTSVCASLSQLAASDPGRHLLPSQAAELLPRPKGAKPPHPSVFSRWSKHGVRAPDGRIVKLRTGRVGRRMTITPQDLVAFIAAAGTRKEAA